MGFGMEGRLRISSLGIPGYLAVSASVQSPGVNAILATNGIFRIDDSGSLLSSGFGTGGFVNLQTLIGSNFDPKQLSIQKDSKIVICGSNGSNGVTIIRLNTNGTLDPSFNGSGIFTLPGEDYLYNVKVTKSGKIVSCGSRTTSSSRSLVICLNSNGTLNTAFGSGGIYHYSVGDSELYGIDEQKDGKLVFSGWNDDSGLLIRLHSNGTPDMGFGTAGIVVSKTVSSYMGYWSLVVQKNGRIIAVGNSGDDNSAIIGAYKPNGVLDSSFGNAGAIIVVYPGYSSGFQDLLSFCDNSIIVTGYGFENTLVFKTAKYDVNGNLVSSFGSGGVVSLSGPVLEGLAVVQLGNGSLLYASYMEIFNLSCR